MLPKPPALPQGLTQKNCGGQWLPIVATNPETVCAPESILVCALRSVGVQLHPAFGFQKFEDDRGAFWRWMVSDKSQDGLYKTTDLIKWWMDAAWLAANPTHEWAILRAGLHNMALQAGEVRDQITLLVVRKGKMEAHIPANASPALRAHRLGQLEGTVPMNAVFIEPAEAQEPETRNAKPENSPA